MKEQLHAPIGEGSDKTEKEGAPKALSKPMLPKGLENVQVPAETLVGWRCWCGVASKGRSHCRDIPILSTDGWSGNGRYDGAPREFSQAEIEKYRAMEDPK